MISHAQLIQLIIAYTLAGAFVFTVFVTCLSLVGWIRFADPAQQRKLFYALTLELVALCIGFFAGFLKFDPKAVADDLRRQAEVKGDVARAIGLVQFSARANDFLPRLGDLVYYAKQDILLSGVSFYVTVPEHKELFIQKAESGVRVRFLVFDYIDGDLPEVASGFSQTTNELRSECITTMLGLESIRQALSGHTGVTNFEVRLYTETPRARFYMFDHSRPDGQTYFVPHINGVNSPNLPGLLFTNVPGNMAELYAPSVERLWSRSTPLDDWRKKHPEALNK